MKTQILIVDDHGVVRLGLVYLIRSILNSAVTYEAGNLSEAKKILDEQSINLLILDIGIPDSDGIGMIENIKRRNPKLKILIFSAHKESIYALRCLDAGADGYVQKSVNDNEIKKAILMVLEDRQYISEKVRDHILETRLSFKKKEAVENPLSLLSDRELEVCQFLRKGYGISEIANQMKLHISTVSTYKSHVFQKLSINNINLLVDKMRLYDYYVE